MLSYLELRGGKPGSLFLFQNRKPLTRPRFIEAVRDALKKTRLDEEKYCSHSFRIGVATTAVSKGMEDCIIKTLGSVGECGVFTVYSDPLRAPCKYFW